jgi:hypothetical protein
LAGVVKTPEKKRGHAERRGPCATCASWRRGQGFGPFLSAVVSVLKGIEELHTYVERNQEFVSNYGERYRNGEEIASGFVESAINQVVSKRMVKKQR